MSGKRGLVISGGGAKGAYSFGFLHKLREEGIAFDAVAGTSVGTLNAVIWSTGQFTKANKLWKSLTLDRVYPFKSNFLVAACLAPFIFVAHCYSRFNEGLAPFETDKARVNQVLRMWFMSWNVLPWWVMFAVLFQSTSDWRIKAGVAVVFLLAILSLATQAFRASGMSPVEEWLRVKVFAVHFLIGLLFLISSLYRLFRHERLDAWATVFVPATVLVILLRTVVGSAITSANLLSSLPLAGHIRDFAVSPLRIPTYATVAVKREVFDPDNPTWSPLVGSPDEPHHYDFNPTTVYYPRYLELHRRSFEEICRACLASAALPFGLVAAVKIRKDMCVDGGVIDNVPLWPLIERERCDWLLVLHHSSDDKSTEDQQTSDLEKWQIRERSYRLRGFPMPTSIFKSQDEMPYRKRRWPPRYIPFHRPQFWPRGIFHFYPKRDLGSILKFGEDHMTALIEWGEQDARIFLDENPDFSGIFKDPHTSGTLGPHGPS